MTEKPWDIRREGRAWGEEALSRYSMTPEKFEMVRGKLFWSEEQRLTLFARLLEPLRTRNLTQQVKFRGSQVTYSGPRPRRAGGPLENVGVDKGVRLGDPPVWRGAVDALK